MTTLVTGAGLVGTAYAKEAAKRGDARAVEVLTEPWTK